MMLVAGEQVINLHVVILSGGGPDVPALKF